MVAQLFRHWHLLTHKEKCAVVGLLLGWTFFLLGLTGLYWWSNEKAGSISVQAQSRSQGSTSRVGMMVVDVSGAVQTPGVYALELGSRVADALVAAGYFSEKADYLYIVTELNQARELKDGDKLYIPFYGENPVNVTQKSSPKISVNSSNTSLLEELPDIGSKRAEEIIAGRPYHSLDELVSKKVLSETAFKAIENLIEL